MTNFNKSTAIKELAEVRKYLHANPELSGEESATANYVADFLMHCGASEIERNVAGTGVFGTFSEGNPGPCVLFRAELDALPIEEVNTFSHRSGVAGIAHKCGHDGHMTILLGLAQYLSENPPVRGKVVLLFQPAEETGMGARAVLSDPRFQELEPDYIFALHNLPGHPLGAVILRTGPFTSSVRSLIISLQGKTSHAAEPEHGINPAIAIAEIVQLAAGMTNNDVASRKFNVITPVYVNMGEKAYGTSAGFGEVHFTIRTWTVKYMKELTDDFLASIDEITRKHGLEYRTDWTQSFMTTRNNREAVDIVARAAASCGHPVIEREYPFKWGEDFGYFTRKFRGAMFALGAGEDTAALHNPEYDFPDELLPIGVKMFQTILAEVLAENV